LENNYSINIHYFYKKNLKIKIAKNQVIISINNLIYFIIAA
jgi:hypothetical protein